MLWKIAGWSSSFQGLPARLNTMTIYSLTCGSIFLLAFLLISNREKVNVKANRWLGCFFFCAGCALLGMLAEEAPLSAQYPYLTALTEQTRFVMAPALYLSVLFFTSPHRKTGATTWLHFIPAVLFTLYSTPFLLRAAGLHFHFPWQLPVNATVSRYIGLLMSVVIKVQLLACWILAYRLLWKHRRHIVMTTASTEGVSLWWLRYLLWGVGGMMLLWFNQFFRGSTWVGQFTAQGYLVAIYVAGYFSLRQKEVYRGEVEDKKALQALFTTPQKGEETPPRLSGEQMDLLKAKLDLLMNTSKPYTDNELGLPQLARQMELSVHELSFLLNKGYGQNFFQFINTYRVQRAKELLLSEKHDHLSILGIAFEAGFNSKTTFNTTFRKTVGQSPSVFRRAAAPPGKTG